MNFCDWKILRKLSEDFLATVEVAYVFGKDESKHNALMITNDNRVYCVGSDNCGYLGLGDANPRELPAENVVLSKKRVKGFTCGDLFVVAYLHSGEIYCWGSFPHGNMKSYSPVRLDFYSKVGVNTVACGSKHGVILTNDGEVYTWGNNDWGQLGRTDFNVCEGFNETKIPSIVEGYLKKKLVIDISAGHSFSVALLNDGGAVTWGDNRFGQLGTNQKDDYSVVPVEVSSLKSVILKKVVCGCCHVLALSNEGILYTWGTYMDDSRRGKSILIDKLPVKLNENLRFNDIGALRNCGISVAQCESGKVYVWGFTRKGIFTELVQSLCTSVDQVFAYYSDYIMMPKPMRLKNTKENNNLASRTTTGVEIEENLRKSNLNTFCFNFALNRASEVISSPEFHEWDKDTMKTFLVEYVKKKEEC